MKYSIKTFYDEESRVKVYTLYLDRFLVGELLVCLNRSHVIKHRFGKINHYRSSQIRAEIEKLLRGGENK